MKDFIKSINIKNTAIILLITIAIIFACMYFHADAEYNKLFERAQELCGDAMLDMELEFRNNSSGPISAEAIYRYDEITALYEQNYFFTLSDHLLPLADPELSVQLTPEERVMIADLIQEAYSPSPNWERLLSDIDTIVAKYKY